MQKCAKPYTPKNASEWTRRRHDRDRRERYLARIIGEPTDHQLQLIDGMIRMEWSAFVIERAGGVVALREGREHRRLMFKLLADFEHLVAGPARGSRGKVRDRINAFLAQHEPGAA